MSLTDDVSVSTYLTERCRCRLQVNGNSNLSYNMQGCSDLVVLIDQGAGPAAASLNIVGVNMARIVLSGQVTCTSTARIGLPACRSLFAFGAWFSVDASASCLASSCRLVRGSSTESSRVRSLHVVPLMLLMCLFLRILAKP